MVRAAAGTALAALAAGCAAPGPAPGGPAAAPAYVAPTQGPRATLLVRVVHAGGRYAVSTYEQPVTCSRRREITGGAQKDPERVSTQLAAARLQTLSFMFVRPDTRVCEITISFEPVRARSYLMRSFVEGERCRVELIDATSPDAPAPVQHLRRERLGHGMHDNACRPLANAVMQPAPGTPSTARDGGAPSLDDFRDLLPRR